MASKDTDVAGKHGRERRRDLGDGTSALVAVIADGDGTPASEASPIPVKQTDTLTPGEIFALSTEHGRNFEKANGTFGGTELEVYTADGVLWTASAPVGPGNFTAVSAEQNHTVAGANSAKWDGPSTGDTIEFLDPAAPQGLSGYVALTFWVYISSGYSAGNTITASGWDGAVVGTPLAIEATIDTSLQGMWQLVSISLTDLGLNGQSIDAIRLTFNKAGAPTVVYIDDVGFQETSGAVAFEIRADAGTIFCVDHVVAVIMDDFDATLADASMPALNPIKLLSRPELANGLLSELIMDGGAPVPLFQPFHNVFDFLSSDGTITDAVSGDGITAIKVVSTPSYRIKLRGGEEDLIRFTVRDDLTPFRRWVIYAVGGFEPSA